jgi:HSP20 family protein
MEIRFGNRFVDNRYSEHWLFGPVNGYVKQLEGETAHMVPLVDVTEDKDAYHFSFEMPGLQTESLDARVEDGQLMIAAERKRPEWRQETKVRIAERSYGTIRRAFELPNDASHEKIAAGYKDGVLELTVEKKPECKSAKIPIN